MKTIGVIGGLGPMATVYYLELITKMADVHRDQEHPRIYMQSMPDIPDRTAYILGQSKDNPIHLMIQAGKALQQMGADFITVPCVTAGYFYAQMEEALDISVVNLLQELADASKRRNVQKVGILATSGTNRSGVLTEMIRRQGMEVLLPDESRQEQLMDIIYRQIKGGEAIDWQMFGEIAENLLDNGAECLILGCTELPLLRKELCHCTEKQCADILQNHCIDALEVLAECALSRCGIPIKQGW